MQSHHRLLLLTLTCLLGLHFVRGDATNATTAVTASAIVIPTIQATTVADRNAFIGTYNPVTGCVPSATCCCSTGPITITSATADNQINIAGTTDGGAACMGQTSLSGAFTLNDPLDAFSYVSFVPVLIQLQTEKTHTWLQMTSSKTTCNNVFQRASAASDISSTVSGAITNPANLTSSVPNLVNSTIGSPNATVANAAQVLFPGFNFSAPVLGSNPFAASTQTVAFPPFTTANLSTAPNFALPGQTATSSSSSQVVPPVSTTIPFTGNLPTLNAPFSTNALQAVPTTGSQTATTTSTSTSTTSVPNPFSSAPVLPGQTASTSSNPLSAIPNPFTTTTTSTSSNPLSAIPNPFSQSGSPSPPALPGQTVTTQSTNSSSTGTNFNTTGSNATTSTGGVQYAQELVEAKNTGAATGTKNYLAAFIVPANSNVKFAILHYYTESDMRQKNVYMNLTTSSALAAQLLTAAGSSSASNYFIFVHGPINVDDTDQITYSFTYSTKADGSSAVNSPAYTYSKSSATTPATQVTVPTDALSTLPGVNMTDTPTTSSSDSSTINLNSIWNGEFQADASCVPSDTCCCGVGLMNVSTTLANPNQVQLSGQLDGGAGCLYQTSLTGLMDINSTDPHRASRSIQIPNADHTVITFTAQLSTPVSSDGLTPSSAPNSQLTIWNTFRPCQTVAMKVAAFNPTSNDTSIPDPTQLNNQNSTSSDNSTNSNTTSTALPRDAFIGDYDFDTSCVPSDSCCCAQGPLNIAPVYDWTVLPALPPAMASLASAAASNATHANTSQEILFTASLDGGSACAGMRNVSQVFTLASPTTATFTFAPVSLVAELSASSPSSGFDTMTFKNSLYPTCMSKAKKRAATTTTPPPINTNQTTTPPPTTTDPVTDMTDTQLIALRNQYVGDYDSTGCVVSSSCCCTSGITRISSNSTAAGLIDADTTLAGTGFSCLQKDGPVHMTFSIINATAAESAPFGSSANVKFYANMNEKHQIVVSNTVHPACPTILVKRGSTAGASALQSNTFILSLVLLLATLGMMTQ